MGIIGWDAFILGVKTSESEKREDCIVNFRQFSLKNRLYKIQRKINQVILIVTYGQKSWKIVRRKNATLKSLKCSNILWLMKTEIAWWNEYSGKEFWIPWL